MPERSSSEKSTEKRIEESDSSEDSYEYRKTSERSKKAKAESSDSSEEIKKEKAKIDGAFRKEENKDGYLKAAWKTTDREVFETGVGVTKGILGVAASAVKETVSMSWRTGKFIAKKWWGEIAKATGMGDFFKGFKEAWDYIHKKEDKK